MAGRRTAPARPVLPGQAVLVLQGGGALGACQWGVYQALHERGIEPDWVIGTSIGAINGALIAGNEPGDRVERLGEFWRLVEQRAAPGQLFDWLGLGALTANLSTVSRGIPRFFEPNPQALRGVQAAAGAEQASYCSTQPLRETLTRLVDVELLRSKRTRLCVGAVNVCSGEMRYWACTPTRRSRRCLMTTHGAMRWFSRSTSGRPARTARRPHRHALDPDNQAVAGQVLAPWQGP